ncbi:MAG: hypothetical protein KGS72_18360 [Cyanobacteria bacterium REEB67]|nr:hypothetical protein [Cyanobacteria bacterium REEB67]
MRVEAIVNFLIVCLVKERWPIEQAIQQNHNDTARGANQSKKKKEGKKRKKKK